MSDTPPPTPSGATAADAAAARDQVEEQARLVYAAAIAWIALHGDEEPPENSPVMKAAKTMALVLLRAVRRMSATRPKVPTGEARQRWIEDHAAKITDRAVAQSRAHYRTVAKRAKRENPDATEKMIMATFRADNPWKDAAGRTAATWESSQTALEMHPLIEDDSGEPHSKLWISRGDPKVRTLHRRLHGRVREIGEPFHTDMKSGKDLRYPGDDKAAPGDAINCRCVLFLVPSRHAAKAAEVFTPSVHEFDVPVPESGLAASGWLSERAVRELRSELARSYL